MEKYAKVTNKILDYYPDWKSIVDKVGIILEQTNTSARIHIISDGKRHLNIIYTVPIVCVKIISKEEAVAEVFIINH